MQFLEVTSCDGRAKVMEFHCSAVSRHYIMASALPQRLGAARADSRARSRRDVDGIVAIKLLCTVTAVWTRVTAQCHALQHASELVVSALGSPRLLRNCALPFCA
jgi:hypothetical protein